MNIANPGKALPGSLMLAIASIAAVALCGGCAHSAYQNDRESINPATGFHAVDTSSGGEERGPFHHKDVEHVALITTNSDGTISYDHSSAVDSGFNWPFAGHPKEPQPGVPGIPNIPPAPPVPGWQAGGQWQPQVPPPNPAALSQAPAGRPPYVGYQYSHPEQFRQPGTELWLDPITGQLYIRRHTSYSYWRNSAYYP